MGKNITTVALFCILFYTANSQQNMLLRKDSLLTIMTKVADWQIKEWSEGHMINPIKTDWENGALYTGIMAFSAIAKDKKYDDFLYKIGDEVDWATGKRKLFADDYCIAQMFSQMYMRQKEPKMLAKWQLQADSIVAHEFNESLQVAPELHLREWTWCDALFMAPPSLAYLSTASSNKKYLQKADSLWWKTSDYLFDKNDSLFYRDSRFFEKREANGKKVFWSRGNGWVMGGLVRMMDNMPKNFYNKAKYIQQFKQMAAKIASLQQADGSWHASLYDPVTFNEKETSGTAFYCYAITWGINNGFLASKEYLPVVTKAWTALVASVHPDGKLGYVQNVGDKPVAAAYESTNVYGVGALLLAGSELYKLSRK